MQFKEDSLLGVTMLGLTKAKLPDSEDPAGSGNGSITGRDLLEFPDPGSAPQQPQPWGRLGREPEKWSSLILLLK